jgi:hypothetical protein
MSRPKLKEETDVIRVPISTKAIIQQKAKELHMSVPDYVGSVFANCGDAK